MKLEMVVLLKVVSRVIMVNRLLDQDGDQVTRMLETEHDVDLLDPRRLVPDINIIMKMRSWKRKII